MPTRSPNRLVGIVVGTVYLAVGILGFTATAGVDFFDSEGGLLFGFFGVNQLLNVVHLLVGAALLLAALSSVTAARTVNASVGGFLLIFGLAGLFLVGTAANIFALNVADNVLHFGCAALLLAVGLGAQDEPNRGATDQ